MYRILHSSLGLGSSYLPMPCACARNMHVIINPKIILTFCSVYLILEKREQKVSGDKFIITLMCTHCQMDKN